MIVHILLCKPREDLTAAEAAELASAVAALDGVPGVERMTHGPDFSGRGRGYTHGAVMHFADRDALQHYAEDEEHLRIVTILQRLTLDRLVVDYETATSGIST